MTSKAEGKKGKSKRLSPAEREDWMVKTYVAGTLDALKAMAMAPSE